MLKHVVLKKIGKHFTIGLIIFGIVISTSIFVYRFKFHKDNEQNNALPLAQHENTKDEAGEIAQQKTPSNDETSISKQTDPIPAKFDINVPFMTQAPLYNWDSLHEDACEEASILMLNHYFKKTGINSRQSFENEIQAMVLYENQHGYAGSISLSDLSVIAVRYLELPGLNVNTVSTVDDLKNIIYFNGPVVVGAAGKELGNPNFRNGGPNYHMLVVKGYDEYSFITNDPGTRKGENYYYNQDVLLNAIHDWNPTDITLGAKNVLFAS